MTLMSSISKLTTSVDQLAGEANVTKAQLDAKVALADATVTATQAEQLAIEATRDEAAAHAADAATHLATMKADVTYQGISAILAEKGVTAVDVFVYDTTEDSDGGAWRKRCHHTSWYNEPLNTATRGARREFPAVAVIVAETGKVTIYDGDDPSLPLWMQFSIITTYTGRMITGGNDPRTVRLCALNGKMVVGTQNEAAGNTGTNGLFRVDFIADQGRKTTSGGDKIYKGTIADRNSAAGNDYLNDPSTGGAPLAYTSVYSVDLAVLPDAPIDPATGLPIPTILAVCGRSDIVHGISVLKDDGTVVDLVNYVSQPVQAAFVKVGGETKIFTTSRYNNWVGMFDIPDADFNTGPYLWGFQHGGGVVWFGQRFADTDAHLIVGANNGVVIFNKDEQLTNLQGASTSNRWQQMSAVTASDYATGWLPGDAKAALLASIDQAPLNACVVAQDDFDDGIDGWGAQTFYNSIVSAYAGKLRVQSQPDQNYAFASRSFTGLEVGAAYQLSIDIQVNAKSALLYVGYPGASTSYHTNLPLGTGARTVKFIARNSTLNVQPGTYLPDADVEFDNLVVERADHDRSVHNGHLVVNGTIVRSPVAGGAELVGYSGFSYSNYLEQPYNSALDFGTGDFCVMGWATNPNVSQRTFISRMIDGDAGFNLQINAASRLQLVLSDGAALSDISSAASFVGQFSGFRFLVGLRRAGVCEVWADGKLLLSAPSTLNVTPSGLPGLRVGLNSDGAFPADSVALWRISATAPTPEQIVKIYEDERKLFMPGAACTLYGTSDAVTALAHDPKTNLLHVGTSAGRSTFDGLVRVANTTTSVATAISAVNGLIAEQ